MITQTKIKKIEEKITNFLETLSEEEKIDYKINSTKDNNLSFNLNVSFTLSKSDEKNYRLQKNLCTRVGFTQNVIGMSFTTTNGSRRTIINIKPRNNKYPVIVRCELSQKDYKYPVSLIISELGGVKMINRNANLEQLTK